MIFVLDKRLLHYRNKFCTQNQFMHWKSSVTRYLRYLANLAGSPVKGIVNLCIVEIIYVLENQFPYCRNDFCTGH